MKFLIDFLFIFSFAFFGMSIGFTLTCLIHGYFGMAWIGALLAAYTGPVSYILNTMEFVEEE